METPMPLDLTTIPLAEIQNILAVLTKQKPFTWDLFPQCVKVLEWAYQQLKGQPPVDVIGSTGVSDEEAISAILDGTAVDDGAIGGGILLSIAVPILIKVVTKVLADYFNK
jgi:hypothetical protein